MKVFDNCLVSDSGYTCILPRGDGTVGAIQHSIVEIWLTEEDKRMIREPEEVWKEFKGV